MRNRINRRKWVRGSFWAASLLAVVCAAVPARAVDKEPDPADVALAARFAELAQNTTRGQNPVDATFRMAAVLFEAAGRLDPTDPRYPHLQAEAMIQARDPVGALKALRAYLALRPDDQFAMVQFAELVTSSFESLDKRLAYLRDKVADQRIAPEVRAHLAFRASQVCAERSDAEGVKQYLDAAIKLNPLSLEALRVYYAQTSPTATPLQRVVTLMAVLRSNPNQSEAMMSLAQQLGDVGLAQQSAQFYGLAANLAGRNGKGVSRDEALNYGCELYIIAQSAMTKQIVDQLLSVNFSDYELALLRLFAERGVDGGDFTEKSQLQAQNAFANRVVSLRKLGGDTTATTRPVDSTSQVELGDLAADIAKVKTGIKLPPADPAVPGAPTPPTPDQIRDAWAGLLADLAWYQLYFQNKAGEAKVTTDLLKSLVGEAAASVARLEGWNFLLSGRADEAKVKLSAIAETDAIARLGLIKLAATPATVAKTKADGEKLLLEHASGIVAVTIVDALREVKPSLAPSAGKVQPILAELTKFPTAWLQILDKPAAFYTISVEPVRVANPYGDPIIVRVTVKNTGDYPITIGPDGVLHSDLWFDAFFRGMTQQGFPGTAIDRLAGPLVLQPSATAVQDVRIDQGALSGALQTSPLPSLQLVVQVRTNPAGNNTLLPAGQTNTNSRSIERVGFNLERFTSLITTIAQGNNAEKLRSIDLAGALASILAQPANNEQTKQGAVQLIEAVRAAQKDASPSVAAWAAGAIALRTPEADRPAAIQRMINDAAWQTRCLGIAVAGILPPETQRSVVRQLAEKDPDPIVKQYAACALEISGMNQAATKPSSAPATTPAITPAITPSSGRDTFSPAPRASTGPSTKPVTP